jgi:hypothetical protein
MYVSDVSLLHFQITVTKQYLELEPIGVLFIIFFGVILIIQFLAMLVHRFGTLSHMLSTTQINWFRTGPQVGNHRTLALNLLAGACVHNDVCI